MTEEIRGDELKKRYERAEKGRDVVLNQTFKPLLLDYIISGGGPAGFLAYSTIHLDLLCLPKVNISIAVSANSRAKKSDTITPFEPEQGYQLTDEDYFLEQRKRKSILMLDEKIKGNSRLQFDATILNQNNEEIDPEFKEKILLLKLLTELRAVVTMGNEVFESRLSDDFVFENFYPQDRGPLPTDRESGLEEGLNINIPYSAVESIEMKFILVREKAQATSK